MVDGLMGLVKLGFRYRVGNFKQAGQIANLVASSPEMARRFGKFDARRQLGILFHASPFGQAGKTTTHRRQSARAQRDLDYVQRGRRKGT